MKYEIMKVANGFIVQRPYDPSRGFEVKSEDVFVFNTWPSASAWIDDQFAKTQKEAGK